MKRTACSIPMQLWKLGGHRSGLLPPPTLFQFPRVRFQIDVFVEHAAYKDGMVEGNRCGCHCAAGVDDRGQWIVWSVVRVWSLDGTRLRLELHPRAPGPSILSSGVE